MSAILIPYLFIFPPHSVVQHRFDVSMIYSREVYFDQSCPSIDEIINRVEQRTGIQATYLANKWLLVNPLNQEDIFSLYQDRQSMILTSEGSTTDLLTATLYTLIEMGGYYTDWNN